MTTAAIETSWQHMVFGCVEEINRKQATGWVVGPEDKLPVQLALYLDDLKVRTVWSDQPNSANTVGAARSFRIPLRGVWPFCDPTTQVSVRLDGVPIPIAGKGIFKRVGTDGEYTVADLREKLAQGYVFTDYGDLQLSKKLDVDWQAAVIGMYDRVAELLQSAHGYEAFVVYGSLLGQVREQGFISHDDDFDVAYVSRLSGPDAAAELRDIGLTMIDAGFEVDQRRTALHIHDSDDPDLRVDLFHLYFDDAGNLQMPFGRAGVSELPRAAWQGTEPGRMGEHTVRVPKHAEQWVEHIYGSSWQIPQPGFNWDRARTAQPTDGFVTEQLRQPVYWANFYAHHTASVGSQFSGFVGGYPGLPSMVLDIGCGDGRDSFAFAELGRRVIGADRSHVGVEHASKRAGELGLGDQLSFEALDAGNPEAVERLIARAREFEDTVLFYMRFFLHSIPEDVQDRLLAVVAQNARQGDALAAEFRTDKDAELKKVHGGHYRRYQNAVDFARRLESEYGFGIDFEIESTGLAPYNNEDPVVYRVIALKL
ncbi:MAG: methyltransferase domain-containing protein [Rhodococcus sp.]|nr:methyltransferase domain-containing protein [Rhodococcus sp. (in: high G+C Gram-positive bacteria)]